MHVYIINLERSLERRAHMMSELEKVHLEYSFVTAIDDRQLDLSDSNLVHPSYQARNDWRPGRIGNGLSHLRVCEAIIASGAEHALILEDDVKVGPELADLLDALTVYMTGAEVALLHFDSHDTCELSRHGAAKLPACRTLAYPIDLGVPVGAAAYVITREACERVARIGLPIRAHSDDWLHWYNEFALDRVRCVFPHAVTKDSRFESTIEYVSPSSLKAQSMKVLRRLPIPMLSTAISYRRRRIWRKWTKVALVDKPFVTVPSRLQ